MSNPAQKLQILHLSKLAAGRCNSERIWAMTSMSSKEERFSWRSSSARREGECDRKHTQRRKLPGELESYLEDFWKASANHTTKWTNSCQTLTERTLQLMKAKVENGTDWGNENVTVDSQENGSIRESPPEMKMRQENAHGWRNVPEKQ